MLLTLCAPWKPSFKTMSFEWYCLLLNPVLGLLQMPQNIITPSKDLLERSWQVSQNHRLCGTFCEVLSPEPQIHNFAIRFFLVSQHWAIVKLKTKPPICFSIQFGEFSFRCFAFSWNHCRDFVLEFISFNFVLDVSAMWPMYGEE